MKSLDIAATGMLAQQMNVDVISNNISNMSTTGFKRQNVAFTDMIYQNVKRPGSTSSDVGTIMPSGLQLGLGTRVNGIYRTHEQGTLQITDNALDLAVLGEGYFQIEMPDGEIAYTRDGSFKVNQDGEIVTNQGFRVEPGIVIPEDAIDITINKNGEVFAKLNAQPELENLGQIEIATFVNETGLDAIGKNLLLESAASGPPTLGTPGQDQFGEISQGALEASNVDVVEEITNLISAQRAYEMNSKVITTSDEMMQTVSQMR